MDVGMVFGILFAVIVIILLVGFGLDALGDLEKTARAAQIRTALNDLEATADNVDTLATGSTLKFLFHIPSGVRFCFVDSANPGRAVYTDASRNWEPDPIIERHIQEEGFTVWTIDESAGEQNGYAIAHLVPAGGSFCADDNTGLLLENQGLTVVISD